MRTIRVSEEVWQAIASQGKFGEIEDDVLRRVLQLPITNSEFERDPANVRHVTQIPSRAGRRRSFATQRMTSYIARNQLHIEFEEGASSSWPLPKPNDKAGIRIVLDKAIDFAKKNGATIGQINAARKTLTSEGYHLTK